MTASTAAIRARSSEESRYLSSSIGFGERYSKKTGSDDLRFPDEGWLVVSAWTALSWNSILLGSVCTSRISSLLNPALENKEPSSVKHTPGGEAVARSGF